MALVYLVSVPLAWAALLAFHPNPDPHDIYGTVGAVGWLVAVLAAAVASAAPARRCRRRWFWDCRRSR